MGSAGTEMNHSMETSAHSRSAFAGGLGGYVAGGIGGGIAALNTSGGNLIAAGAGLLGGGLCGGVTGVSVGGSVGRKVQETASRRGWTEGMDAVTGEVAGFLAGSAAGGLVGTLVGGMLGLTLSTAVVSSHGTGAKGAASKAFGQLGHSAVSENTRQKVSGTIGTDGVWFLKWWAEDAA